MAPTTFGARRFVLRTLYLVFDAGGQAWSTEDAEEASAWTAGEEPVFIRVTAAAPGGRVVSRAGAVFEPLPWSRPAPERLRLAVSRLVDAMAIELRGPGAAQSGGRR